MNSTLKVLVPLALMIAVVFAVTYFAQYTPTEREDTDNKASNGVGGDRPLRFFTTSRQWNPSPEASLQDQSFPGFFEASNEEQRTTFWFENRNPASVSLQLLKVSCSACSGGEVAPIPSEATKLLLQMSAVSALPQGLISPLPLGMAAPAANILDKGRPTLKWQSHRFNEDPAQVVYNVPAAADTDGWSPQWGILELNFKVREGQQRSLQAWFKSQVHNSTTMGMDEFTISFAQVPPFELTKQAIDVGELNDASRTAVEDSFVIYSLTRGPEDLSSLNVRVTMPQGESGDPGAFVTAGPMVPLKPQELDQLKISDKAFSKRVRTAYRVPVTVRTRENEARLPIGKLQREIWVSIPGNEPSKRVVLNGMVRGPVYLSDGKLIDLGSFRSSEGVSSHYGITTERTGIELAVVADQCRPKSMKVTLVKQPDRDDRGYYEVKVAIPKDEQQGEIVDGVVVLEVKGTRQQFRISVKGRGIR